MSMTIAAAMTATSAIGNRYLIENHMGRFGKEWPFSLGAGKIHQDIVGRRIANPRQFVPVS